MVKKIEIPKFILVMFGIIVFFVLFIIVSSYIKETKFEKKYEIEKEKEFEEIEYVIPEMFEKSEDYTSYSYGENNVHCYAYFYASKKYDYNFETWFKERVHITLDDEVSKLEETIVDGRKGYHVNVKSGRRDEHYYGFESTNYYYSLSYSITDYKNGDREDKDTNPCYIAEHKIIDSIKLK